MIVIFLVVMCFLLLSPALGAFAMWVREMFE